MNGGLKSWTTWTYLEHNGIERNEGELVLLLNGGVPVTFGITQAIRGLAWKVGQNGIIQLMNSYFA